MPESKHPYEDILNFPHPVSERHPRMSIHDRAAQFSPFAALTGYEATIQEAARLTERKIELSEDQKVKLDARLCLLVEALPQRPEAVFTYFLPDSRKRGGSYVTAVGALKRVDDVQGLILLTDGTEIPIEDVLDIQCEALGFDELEQPL